MSHTEPRLVERNELRRVMLMIAALFTPIVVLGCVAFLLRHSTWRLSSERVVNYYLYHQDLGAAALFVLIFVAACWWSRRRDPPQSASRVVGASGFAIAGVAAVVAVVAYAGTSWIFLRYGLSMDEFMADFDAKILRGGSLLAPVPPEWSPYLRALQPLFRMTALGNAYWASSYLPVNAALRALFGIAGDAAMTGPFLAAAAVVLLYLVAKQLFPDDRECQLVAVVLLATSAQFLLAAMTPYAMTAHLALNLAWLWLVLRDRVWSHATAAAVTFAACGIHQLIFHPLFAAPFVLLMLAQRRWRLAAYYTGVFATAGLFWVLYWSLAVKTLAPVPAAVPGVAQAAPGAGAFMHLVEQMLAAARPTSLYVMTLNVVRFLVWQNPMALVLVAAAASAWRQWPPVAFALLGGLALTLLTMFVMVPYQGHGLGYRYLHGLLGSVALLGAFGWRTLRDRASVRPAELRTTLWIFVAVSLLVLLPLRAWQAQAMVRPYVVALDAIRRSDAHVVLVDRDGLWFGNDLVRNDPHLRARPVVMDLQFLSGDDLRRICGRDSVQIFDRSHPAASDIRPATSIEAGPSNDDRRALLRAIGCGAPVPAGRD